MSNAAADWYVDPADLGRWRWWDGRRWTDATHPRSPLAGWYVDPGDPAQLRWWDGTTWAATSTTRPDVIPPAY